MHRFYGIQDPQDPSFCFLSPEDAAHAFRVLRLKAGDEAEIVLEGRRYLSKLEPPDRALLASPLPSTEAALRITLFQGIPKGDKMDLIVQKAVELGCDRLVPLQMKRCVSHPDEKGAARKRERWQKIAREAGKQSGRCLEMEVTSPISMRELPKYLSPLQKLCIPWEEEHALSLKAFHDMHPDISSLGLLIGPEGGIDPEEMDTLTALGGCAVTLGPRILRTETAGLCALSALFCLYGDMEGMA